MFMNKYRLLIIYFFFILFSCTNSDNDDITNTCSVSNPIEDLDWLKLKIEELKQTNSTIIEYFYVSQNLYNDKTVFIFPNCCPQCSTIIPVYNCEGNTLGFVGDGNIDTNILNNDIIIWKPENFACD